jgi:hypothetical protein
MNAPPHCEERGGSRREQGSEPPSPRLLGIEQRGNAELQAACYSLRRVAAARSELRVRRRGLAGPLRD